MIDTSLNRIPVIVVTAHMSEEYEKSPPIFLFYKDRVKPFNEIAGNANGNGFRFV